MQSIVDLLIYIMDQVGFAVCHQLPERTLGFGGRQLPVCARDTGLFLGLAVCFAILLIAYRTGSVAYPSVVKTALIACFIVPMLLDVFTVSVGLRSTGNEIRLVTGCFAGTGIAALVYPLVAKAFFREEKKAKMFRQWWSLILLAVIPAGIFLVLQPEFPGAYWIWAPAVTAAIVFTFFILSYTFLTLATEWWSGRSCQGFRISMMLYAVVMVAAELVVFNRLHWLAAKLWKLG